MFNKIFKKKSLAQEQSLLHPITKKLINDSMQSTTISSDKTFMDDMLFSFENFKVFDESLSQEPSCTQSMNSTSTLNSTTTTTELVTSDNFIGGYHNYQSDLEKILSKPKEAKEMNFYSPSSDIQKDHISRVSSPLSQTFMNSEPHSDESKDVSVHRLAQDSLLNKTVNESVQLTQLAPDSLLKTSKSRPRSTRSVAISESSRRTTHSEHDKLSMRSTVSLKKREPQKILPESVPTLVNHLDSTRSHRLTQGSRQSNSSSSSIVSRKPGRPQADTLNDNISRTGCENDEDSDEEPLFHIISQKSKDNMKTSLKTHGIDNKKDMVSSNKVNVDKASKKGKEASKTQVIPSITDLSQLNLNPEQQKQMLMMYYTQMALMQQQIDMQNILKKELPKEPKETRREERKRRKAMEKEENVDQSIIIAREISSKNDMNAGQNDGKERIDSE